MNKFRILNYFKILDELYDWLWDEIYSGNHEKAARINNVLMRTKERLGVE